MSTKSDQLRAEAAAQRAAAEESWQRSDTDGFLSQWAGGLNAQLKDRQADIEDNGGIASFPGLFYRATGERVRARIVYVQDRYSYDGAKKPLWLVLDSEDNAVLWLPAYKGDSTRSKLHKLGFAEVDEQAPAVAYMNGSGTGLSGRAWVATKRTDGGFPEGAVPYDKLGGAIQ